MHDGAAALPDFDIEGTLKKYGLANVHSFSDDAVVLGSVIIPLAQYASRLDAAVNLKLRERGADMLKAAGVIGGPEILRNEFKRARKAHKDATKRSAATASVAAASEWAELPAGVHAATDLGTACYVRHHFGDRIRFVPNVGFLHNSGTHWVHDIGSIESRRAVHAAACMLESTSGALTTEAASAAQSGNNDQAARLRTKATVAREWSQAGQKTSRVDASLKEISVLKGIAVPAESLDADPLALACLNGTLDLAIGELRPHRSEDLISRCTGVAFDKNAQCPTFEQTLERIQPDPEVREFLQRFAGYSLTGFTSEQCLAIFYGVGANGKTTFLEAMRAALGDYAANANTDTLMFDKGRRGPQNDIARLRGARLVTAAESGEGRRLDEELVKRLTGGDRITARFLFKEHFEFTPQFKLWLAVNDRPEIRGVDLGIWRRMRLVHFSVTIPPEEQDHNLAAKLKAEAPGILAWAVRGCLQWRREGLPAPAAVLAATDEWRAESNIVAQFIDERCQLHQQAKQTSGSLYGAFAEWARSQGVEAIDQRVFGKRLSALGYESSRTNQARYWLGLSLRQEESQ